MCSISRDPGREECTICTAVTPDAVFTVRRYGDTSPPYGQLLDLAGADESTRKWIGDMIVAVKRGGQLPAIEDVRRRLGLGLGQPGITVAEWLDTWLAGKRRTKRESTARSYEMHIRIWLKPQLGHLPLERLNTGHIEGLFATIARFNAEVERQRGEGKALIEIDGDVRSQPGICGPSTQRRIFATLKAACNAAVRQRKIIWNPCVGVDLETPEMAERKRWSPAESARFIASVADDPMGLMFRIAVLRGCRRGELVGFRWTGSDLDRRLLLVERTILQLGGRRTESRAKTAAGARKVFLDKDTAGLLREHRKAQLRERMQAGPAWQDDDLVFCQPDGQPWNPDHVSRRFKRLAAQAGVQSSRCTRADGTRATR